MNSLCVLLVDPSQGLSGPPGPEGAEGKPGTQVPILYRISIPLPVNALYMSVCHLHFLFFKKKKLYGLHKQLITHYHTTSLALRGGILTDCLDGHALRLLNNCQVYYNMQQ